jgi:hypothetical protein
LTLALHGTTPSLDGVLAPTLVDGTIIYLIEEIKIDFFINYLIRIINK